jgi:uncharacterized protein (PEP-CTERM system associated)
MTIPTAKEPGTPNRRALRRAAPLAVGALIACAECRAEFKIAPSFSARETCTDNVNQQPDEFARSQIITDLAPGLSVSDSSRRLKLAANAQFHLFGYTNDDPAARRYLANSSYQYNAHALAEVLDRTLFVEASANRSRQSTSAFAPLAADLYSNINRTDINTWSISPYLRHRFGHFADATVRFTRDSVTGGTVGFGNSMGSTRAANLASAQPASAFGWNLAYSHQDLTQTSTQGLSAGGGKSSSENEIAGISYRLQRTLSLTADAGYDDYEYPALNDRTAGRRWSAGFIWAPSVRTNVRASFGHRYFGKTGALNASHRTRNTVWSLVYSDDVTTMRSQFLLPAAIDTASMLDRLFSSQLPDPVLRQQAVQAYMAATGLPPTLAQSVNYLSNRYLRDQRLQGAMLWKLPHSDLTFTLFRDERVALSLRESDSLLLGAQQRALNDNLRERGATLTANHALSARASLTAGLEAVRARSLITGIENYSRNLHAGINHRFSKYAVGSLDVRQMRGAVGFNIPNYHENAVVAMYTVQY